MARRPPSATRSVTRQDTLFDVAAAAKDAVRLEDETGSNLSTMADKRIDRKLVTLSSTLQAVDDPIKRARLASQIRDVADDMVGSSIRQANRAGVTWREIGAALGIPFQTLYRRYGAG